MSFKDRFSIISMKFPSIKQSISSVFSKIKIVLVSVFRFIYQIISFVFRFLFLVFDQIFGTIPSLLRANRILKVKIQNLQIEGVSDSDPRLQLPIDHLESHIKLEIDRLIRIEEKAKSMVLGVGITISLVTAIILVPTQPVMFVNYPFNVKLVLISIIGLANFFLLVSGYLALSAFKVGEISFPRLEDHPLIVTEEEIRENLILLIDMNVFRIIQKANMLSASMDCLRNGLFLFFLLLIGSLLSIF